MSEKGAMNVSDLQSLHGSASASGFFPAAGSQALEQAMPMNMKGVPGLMESDARQAFNEIDFDQNGFIGASELRYMLMLLGERPSDAELDEMLRMCDCGGDGQASFKDFRRLLEPSHPVAADMANIVKGLKEAAAPTQEELEEEHRRLHGKPKLDGPSVRDIDLMSEAAAAFAYMGKHSTLAMVSHLPKTHPKRPGALRSRPVKEEPPLALSPKASKLAQKQQEVMMKSIKKPGQQQKGAGKGGDPNAFKPPQ